MSASDIADVAVVFVLAAVSGMGLGGGGLLVAYLTFLRGFGQLEAQGANLVFYVGSALSALVMHMKKRNIFWPLIGVMIVPGALGSLAGTAAAHLADPSLVRRVFAVFMILCGLAAWKQSLK